MSNTKTNKKKNKEVENKTIIEINSKVIKNLKQNETVLISNATLAKTNSALVNEFMSAVANKKITVKML